MNILGWVGTAMTAIGAAIMWAAGHLEGQKIGEDNMKDRISKATFSVFNKKEEGPGAVVMVHAPGTEFEIQDPERGLTYGDIKRYTEEHPESYFAGSEFDDIRITEECNEDDD